MFSVLGHNALVYIIVLKNCLSLASSSLESTRKVKRPSERPPLRWNTLVKKNLSKIEIDDEVDESVKNQVRKKILWIISRSDVVVRSVQTS